MLSVLSITFPIFAIVGLGYVLTRKGVFAPRDMAVLGNFVMMLAMPALLFHATATRSFGELIDPGFLVLLALAGLTTQGIAWTALKLWGTGPARRAIGVLGAATPNSAFLAYPIMQILFPEIAPRVLAMCLLVENFVLSPIGLVMIEATNPSEQRHPLRVIGTLALSVLRRPFIIGLILGAGVSVSGLHMPVALDRTLDLLSQAASPLALFVIGGSLVGLPLRGNFRLAGALAAFKLFLHPLIALTWVLMLVLIGLPAPSGDWEVALILSTAMPIFGIFPLLARNSPHSGAASLAVMVSTVGAFFSLPVLIALLA
ncbi:AEC family transporter [Pseudooceanicola algae]|uniref:Uncharacterized protein n=1 Tax=Pseudooceanicola algae TaxID=1537215 RepID=A0A418SB80_9RHOB|nr:AEC family transporter [Pseudooceanicola algae]QPM91372.1 hypothetical protein PSAL_026250 [Pseudooceanicola algae]